MSIKERVFEIIQPDKGNSLASRMFDRVITTLILLSVAAVFAITFNLPGKVRMALCVVEVTASSIFTVEYALRIWTADRLYPRLSPWTARLRYLVSFMAIVDLLAILPFWLPRIFPGSMLGMRALRLVRLLRILKLNRYFDAMKSILDVVAAKRRELVGSVFFVFLLMMVSSLVMYSVEHEAQPDVFRNAFSGLWWAVSTLTTVGYGDIYPVTTIGRVFGAAIALSGVAALAIPTGIVTSGIMEGVRKPSPAGGDGRREAEEGDADRDRLLREQGEAIKALAEQVERLADAMVGGASGGGRKMS